MKIVLENMKFLDKMYNCLFMYCFRVYNLFIILLRMLFLPYNNKRSIRMNARIFILFSGKGFSRKRINDGGRKRRQTDAGNGKC